MQLADIPVDEAQHRRARTLHLRMAEIIADRDVPGNIDGLRRGLEKALRERRWPSAQALLQDHRLLRGHRHALAVDRVEAADCIAEHQITLREAREPLVTPAQAGDVAIADVVGQRLCPGDDIVDFLGRHRREVCEEPRIVIGRVVAEETADADGPGIALLRDDHAIAPVRCTAGNHNTDLDLLVGWPLVAKLLQPRRARRAASARVDYEISRNRLICLAFDTNAHAGDLAARVIAGEALDRAPLDQAHVRHCLQPASDMAFKHGTADQQAGQIARRLCQSHVMANPFHIIDDVAEQATALADHFVGEPRKELFEHDASARQ